MTTDLFDTTTVPHWRPAGQTTLTGPTRVRVGDPCLGLEDLTVKLAAGTWVWEVRDADETGRSVEREWEVRLRREDQPAAEDWTWTDPYGFWADQPADQVRVDGFRGVDAGRIAWALGDAYFPEDPDGLGDLDDRGLLEARVDGRATDSGRVLVTYSGWGDGSYPVAVRYLDGEPVEVRACYIVGDPGPVTAAEFTALLPDAFRPNRRPAGPLTLHLTRTRYTTQENGDPDRLVERGYDQLHALTVRDGTGAATRISGRYAEDIEYDPMTIDKVGGLWGRLPDTEKAALGIEEVVGDYHDEPRHARGRISAYATAEVAVTLTP